MEEGECVILPCVNEGSQEKNIPQISVQEIRETHKDIQIEGAYLTPSDFDPEKKGDGYSIFQDTSGNSVVLLVDVSLGGGNQTDRQGESINESRILSDILLACKDTGKNPQYLLQELRKFYPKYLEVSKGWFDWGFSLTALAFDKTKNAFQIASMGTNYVGVESSRHAVFDSVIRPDTEFFSPESTSRKGKRLEIQMATIPTQRSILLTTDGIVITRIGIFGQKRGINLNQNPQDLLRNNNEGLYLVVNHPLTSPTK